MTILYSTLAELYHEMYQHIFDYEKEFEFYHGTLNKINIHRIIEIGCGTGLLGKHFIGHGYDYTGLDISEAMIEIARRENKTGCFMVGDMRSLERGPVYEAVLLTGRTSGYLIHNREILDTLSGIYDILPPHGLFLLDIFDAEKLFGNFKDTSEQNVALQDKSIRRINRMNKNLCTGWTWDWYAEYIIQKNEESMIFNDHSTLRAFTKDEMSLYLQMSGFGIIDVLSDKVMTFITEKKTSK
jgi:SAM-dependent methyltransferase